MLRKQSARVPGLVRVCFKAILNLSSLRYNKIVREL